MNEVERLWYFAQLERGVEESCIDRVPLVGSRNTIKQLMDEYESREPHTSVRPVRQIDVDITVGDINGFCK